MILQRSSSGLYVPYKPPKKPTQAELMAEYHKLHCCCPKCGKIDYEQTCIGRFIFDLEDYEDPNWATCHSCGWHGKIHELTEQPIDNSTNEASTDEV